MKRVPDNTVKKNESVKSEKEKYKKTGMRTWWFIYFVCLLKSEIIFFNEKKFYFFFKWEEILSEIWRLLYLKNSDEVNSMWQHGRWHKYERKWQKLTCSNWNSLSYKPASHDSKACTKAMTQEATKHYTPNILKRATWYVSNP